MKERQLVFNLFIQVFLIDSQMLHTCITGSVFNAKFTNRPNDVELDSQVFITKLCFASLCFVFLYYIILIYIFGFINSC